MDGLTATTSSQAVIKFQAGEQEFLQISRRLPLMAVPMELLGVFAKKAKRLEFALKVIQLQIVNIGRLWNLPRSICPDPCFNMSFCSCAYLVLFYYSPSKLASWVQDPRVKDSSPDRLQLNFELTKRASPFAAIQGLGARHGVFFLIFGHFQRWISVEDGGFLTGFFAVAFHGEILDKV